MAAQEIQLAIEYAPNPIFHSGTPDSAPADVLENFQRKYQPIGTAREKEAMRYVANETSPYARRSARPGPDASTGFSRQSEISLHATSVVGRQPRCRLTKRRTSWAHSKERWQSSRVATAELVSPQQSGLSTKERTSSSQHGGKQNWIGLCPRSAGMSQP